MSKEQVYYELLTRTDHPVFKKDFSLTTDANSPLNSIYNRIFAKQLEKLQELESEMRLNSFANTVTALTIDDWEQTYFGFTKPSLPLSQRVSELVIKFNRRFKMNVTDVIDLARAIVGETPLVVRNVNLQGWVLGQSALGINTAFGGGNSEGLYLVAFSVPVDSNLLKRLDERLTIIEKAGSRHKVTSPVKYWVLGTSSLGIDTTLGA